MNEIGSDFFNVERMDTEFFLSGRTAEEYIIRDILEGQSVSSALLPSYCCYTMIEPFLRHCIPVRFYDITFDNGLAASLPEKKEGEILFYLNYFGYGDIRGLERVQEWDVTIEDCTHSWLCGKESEADYTFTSYRKWTGVAAAARADKKGGSFTVKSAFRQNLVYEKYRRMAIQHKKDYIENGQGDKEIYLGEFRQAEELLGMDYAGYCPEYESLASIFSLDTERIKERRRKNAGVLYEGLRNLDGIKTVFPELKETDVPLNVPVLVPNGLRDRLRKHLIDHAIYCPVHWPVSGAHDIGEKAKELYGMELSLICDQRYGADDMERELQVIREFLDK